MYGGHGAYIMQYRGGKFVKIGGSESAENYNFRFFEPYRVAGYSIFFKGNPKWMPTQFNDNGGIVSGIT